MNIPEGYREDAAGSLVPEANIREQDRIRDELVNELAEEAIIINQQLKQFKTKALTKIANLIELVYERYGLKLGGKKGNVTLISFNGEYKITRTYAERIKFTEELLAAKALINECIERWTANSNDHVRTLVERAFKANDAGKLKTYAVLDLLRLEINDDEWKRAMQALTDSIQVADTAVYVRIYKRIEKTEQYRPIPLDLAAISLIPDEEEVQA